MGLRELPDGIDKVALAARIAAHLGVDFLPEMRSRGARITDEWFRAVIAKLDLAFSVCLGDSKLLKDSKLSTGSLLGHLRTETSLVTGTGTPKSECYICGDRPLDRLGVDVIEIHVALPYERPFSAGLCDAPRFPVCPSCHRILHLEGLQPRELKARIRP